jgi:poly-gamma-glutamate synthesis protein (capsule biosynthesis protein)
MNFRGLIFLILITIKFLNTNCASVIVREEKIQELKFVAVGDVMVHSTQLTSAYSSKCDCWNFKPVFAKVKPYLEKADIRIANLETTLPGNKKQYAGYPNFGTPDSLAEALKEAGFNLITTSNNHSLDTGKKGLRRTLEVLDNLELAHVGTYSDPEEHSLKQIHVIEKNGLKVAFLSYTYGTNGILIPKDVVVNLIDKSKIAEDIRLAKSMQVDAIIVYYHFGDEYTRLPNKFQKEIVDFSFNEGADIILGGHPHVLQPYELKFITDKYGERKQRLVIYSLGNFVSSQRSRYKNGGILFYFTIAKNKNLQIKDVFYEPVYVYVEYGKGVFQYHILPIRDYLGENTIPPLTKSEKNIMLEFLKDTEEHFKKYSYIEIGELVENR